MPFTFTKTPIEGLVIITPRIFPDDRGFFLESYKKSDFEQAGLYCDFVQDNHSKSSCGVLRGLHFQKPPYAQGKLVRVIRGAVWDVAVDLRVGSKSRGQWFGLELNTENKNMLWIPEGFAHGFLTLQDDTEFVYKCTAEYNKESDAGVLWNDNDLAIAWPSLPVPIQVSPKDKILPAFSAI